MTEDDGDSAETDTSGRRVPWRRVVSALALLGLIAIVLPFVVYAVPELVGAEYSYTVLSGSMEPTLQPGDVIIVNSVPASAIGKGDIITYSASGADRPTTHRVIEVVQQDGTRAFRTQGDANEDPDQSLVTPGSIQGKVMSVGGHLLVVPYMGYVLQFANTQYGFVLLLVLPLTLLIVTEIWSVLVTANSRPVETDGAGESDAATERDEASEADEDSWEWGKTSADVDSATTDGQSDSDESEISFSAAELQLGMLVLAGFLAYSIWVAYVTFETWAFGVAGGVGAAFLLLLALYLTGGGSESTDGERDTQADGPTRVTPMTSDGEIVEKDESDSDRTAVPDGDPGPGTSETDWDVSRADETEGGEIDV
jgi:signal peptidase